MRYGKKYDYDLLEKTYVKNNYDLIKTCEELQIKKNTFNQIKRRSFGKIVEIEKELSYEEALQKQLKFWGVID